MSFWGKSFIFDEVPSEFYDLFICEIGGSGVNTSMGQSSVQPYTAKVYRNPKVYLYGMEQTPVLTFQITFGSNSVLDAYKQQAISKWLFGHQDYKKLRIVQCDLQDVYFNCYLTDPQITTIGNLPYVMKCTVVCDQPWAWEYERQYSFTDIINYKEFIIDNTSDNNYYTWPVITIELAQDAQHFELQNLDTNEYMRFDNLLSGETLTIDCENGIINSSSGLLRFDNFKGKMTRFVPGLNHLRFIGSARSVTFKYQNARKVGG